MDRQTFSKLIADVFGYFRSDHPDQAQLDAWFPFVSHISGSKQTIDQIKNAIYLDCNNVPRNLPKAIITAYAKIPHEHTHVVYHRDSDPRFPVELFHQGLSLLLKTRDVVAFGNWADQVGMPMDDQERVRHKANIMTGRWRLDREAFMRNIDRKRKAAAVAISDNCKQFRAGRGPGASNVAEAAAMVEDEEVWRRDKSLPASEPETMPGSFQVGVSVGTGGYPGKEELRKHNLREDRMRDAEMRQPGEEG